MGQVADRKSAGPEDNAMLIQRLSAVLSFLYILEAQADLTFEDGEAPILYNTKGWPAGSPPAGWTSMSAGVLPSQLVTSWLAFWTGSAFEEEKRPSVRRLVKAAGWLLMTTDLATAIRYLFDLLRSGVVIDEDDVAQSADALIRAYRAAADDDDVPHLIFGQALPLAPAMLIDADPSYVGNRQLRRPLPPDIGEILIQTAIDEIDHTRETTSYDTWFVQQIVLGKVLGAVGSLLTEHAPPTPGLTALLDQFEEMTADGFGIRLVTAAYGMVEQITTFSHSFSLIFKGSGDPDWRDRFLTERALVPNSISGLLLDAPAALPPEWQGISSELAPAVATVVLRGGDHFSLSRQVPFTPAELIASERVRKILAEISIVDDSTALAAVCDLLDTARPEPAQKANVDLDQLLGSDVTTSSSTEEDARGAKREARDDFKARLLLAAAIDEANPQIKHSMNALYADRIRQLEGLAGLYPWHASIQLELAIALDENGEHGRALNHIEKALMLEPMESLHWHSFSVILLHESLPDEARIAFMMKEWLASRADRAE